MKFRIIFTILFFTIVLVIKLLGVLITHMYLAVFDKASISKIDWESFFGEFAGCSVGLYVYIIAMIYLFHLLALSYKDPQELSNPGELSD